MRVITLNLNGIRAAANKGFFTWLARQQADVICLQEVRAQEDQLHDAIYRPAGYHCYYAHAAQKGYSGVALYSRVLPDRVITDIDGRCFAQEEGRYLQADFGRLSVASLYLPSGSSGEARQAIKYYFLDELGQALHRFIHHDREYIICGDWNIAHQPIDLKNAKANEKNSGFLPQERAWMDYVLKELGFIDSFRVLNPHPEQYTWWSYRGRAWANNVGWRIDYQIITPRLKNKIQSVGIYKDERFSDHAPLLVDYDL